MKNRPLPLLTFLALLLPGIHMHAGAATIEFLHPDAHALRLGDIKDEASLHAERAHMPAWANNGPKDVRWPSAGEPSTGVHIPAGMDCEGVPGGDALPGTPCDDGDPDTEEDTWDEECNCVGKIIDCEGEIDGTALPGTPCDDGDPNTIDDVWGEDCSCSGTPMDLDCEGVPNGAATPGTPCDDGDPDTGGSTWDNDCNCTGGLPIDCEGVPGGPALPGTACDDGDPDTGGSTWDNDCDCSGGLPLDCEGTPGGNALPGTPCDDGDPDTTNDSWDSDCNCVGLPEGCDQQLTLHITLDDAGSETTWTLFDATGTVTLASGGPYADGQAGTVIVEPICVTVGCYILQVNDASGNGITGGGYVLRDINGRRIIDADGFFGAVSRINALDPRFCLPLSDQSLIAAWCDKTDLVFASSTQIYASFRPGAVGYQFRLFDPHGSYTRRVFRTTQNLVLNNLFTLPVPADIDLNVRVRGLIGGEYTPFGQACIIRQNTVQGNSLLVDATSNPLGLTLYPNPNQGGEVFLRIDGIAPVEQRVDIDVYDLFGKRVFAEQVTMAGETFNHVLRLSDDLAMGMYLVNVRIGDKLYTERLVRH